jgi:hypothetical protein
MGTSSMIANHNEDGTVTATYCHYDGYLSYNGKMLVENYNTPEKAKAVAEAGYLSSLKANLYESVVDSVHNDPSVQYDSPQHFFDEAADYCGAEYLYLFDGEAWFVREVYGKAGYEEVEMNLAANAA